MPLADNLAAAEAVIAAMNQHGFRASNRRSDRLAAAGGIDAALGTALGRQDAGLAGQGVTALRAQTIAPSLAVDAQGQPVGNAVGQFVQIGLADVTANVAQIVPAHAGNCWEQAQVAFLLLHAQFPNIRPLDLMYFRNPQYDHVWVGIGLAPGWSALSPLRVGTQTLRHYNLRNWGPDAVWCDPWQSGGVAYAVKDLVAGRVRNLDAIYRCNTAEAVEDGWPGSYLRVT